MFANQFDLSSPEVEENFQPPELLTEVAAPDPEPEPELDDLTPEGPYGNDTDFIVALEYLTGGYSLFPVNYPPNSTIDSTIYFSIYHRGLKVNNYDTIIISGRDERKEMFKLQIARARFDQFSWQDLTDDQIRLNLDRLYNSYRGWFEMVATVEKYQFLVKASERGVKRQDAIDFLNKKVTVNPLNEVKETPKAPVVEMVVDVPPPPPPPLITPPPEVPLVLPISSATPIVLPPKPIFKNQPPANLSITPEYVPIRPRVELVPLVKTPVELPPPTDTRSIDANRRAQLEKTKARLEQKELLLELQEKQKKLKRTSQQIAINKARAKESRKRKRERDFEEEEEEGAEEEEEEPAQEEEEEEEEEEVLPEVESEEGEEGAEKLEFTCFDAKTLAIPFSSPGADFSKEANEKIKNYLKRQYDKIQTFAEITQEVCIPNKVKDDTSPLFRSYNSSRREQLYTTKEIKCAFGVFGILISMRKCIVIRQGLLKRFSIYQMAMACFIFQKQHYKYSSKEEAEDAGVRAARRTHPRMTDRLINLLSLLAIERPSEEEEKTSNLKLCSPFLMGQRNKRYLGNDYSKLDRTPNKIVINNEVFESDTIEIEKLVFNYEAGRNFRNNQES